MARTTVVPRELLFVPFSGSTAISRGALTKAQIRSRAWRRLFPDIYIHVDAFDPDDHRMWCDAAALLVRSAGGVVDGLSAAFLWNVDLLQRNAPVSVCLPRKARLWPHPRVAPTRSDLPAGDVTSFAGIPLTTPIRTGFDLGRRLPRTDALIAVDAMCRRKTISVARLAEFTVARPGWPGCRQLRSILALAEPLAESPMETRLRLLLIDAGAPPLTAQHEVRDKHGRLIGRVDLAYPQWRIAIEYEGDHHRERAQFRRDVTRLNNLRAAGWLVLRFTADDVLRRPATVVDQVASAIRERTGTRRA